MVTTNFSQGLQVDGSRYTGLGPAALPLQAEYSTRNTQ